MIIHYHNDCWRFYPFGQEKDLCLTVMASGNIILRSLSELNYDESLQFSDFMCKIKDIMTGVLNNKSKKYMEHRISLEFPNTIIQEF